jgi:hypothetical protein
VTGARAREALALGLLLVLPLLAFSPALREQRLLGPGDGVALHLPLKLAVWEAWSRPALPSWNPGIFCGTPLLAAYRPGALFPPTILAAALPGFAAFQALVLFSLGAAGALTFLYLRRLGAGTLGAYVAGLCFSLGPYLVGHLGDTATLVAAPTLPLALLAAEAYVRRWSPGRAAGLAGATALLLLAGSVEVARAGLALLGGRLLVGHAFPGRSRPPSPRATLLTMAAGLALAAPQLLPTALLAREAGRQVTGLSGGSEATLPGVTGLILRYVSHTPAPALGLAALPLVFTEIPVRVLGLALGVCLALQWGRGPLAAPGALALVFDFALAVLAGLSASAQWRARREPFGRRLRSYLLFWALASAAALSLSAALLGQPLPQALAGAVGVLALSFIVMLAAAEAKDPVRAGVFLLPLTVSFLLQPLGRGAWLGAPTRRELESGTATREAIDRAMGLRRSERILTLVRSWPRGDEVDLAYANLAIAAGRRTANGYDPMTPLRTRLAFGLPPREGMGAGGTLPGVFFRTDPRRLETLGIRWAQAPASALVTNPDATGLGDVLDLVVEPGRPRLFPIPLGPATDVRLATSLSNAVGIAQGEPVAKLIVRLGSGRRIELPIRAGIDTAEWAWDRPDVRRTVRHDRAPVLESFRASGPSGAFEGHRYLATLRLPARYSVDAVGLESLSRAGMLALGRLAVFDQVSAALRPVSVVSGYVSDTARFREAAATPAVRLYELPSTPERAHVVERVRSFAGEAQLVEAMARGDGIDPRRAALAVEAELAGATLPPGARSSRAVVLRDTPGRLALRGEGPGLLVVAEGWDPGWSATLDDAPAPLLRVNALQLGVVLPEGVHEVVLRHTPVGFVPGLGLAGAAATCLAVALYRGRAASRI